MNTESLNALAVRGRSGGSPSAATAHCGLLKYGPCQWASSPPGRAGQRNRSGVGIETPGEGVVHPIVDGMRAVLDEQLEDLKRHTRRDVRGRIQAGISPMQRRRPTATGGAGQDGAAARQLAFIRKADTLTELAKKMEVDVGAFLATFERYNGASKQGLDKEPECGKPLKSSKPFDTPPYYAVQILPLARKNFGGAKTDLQCRVLDKHFEPIVGLYAAGEVAGMAGGHINGRAGLEGTMLGPSIFSGRVAGGWAAHAACHGRGFVGKPNRS